MDPLNDCCRVLNEVGANLIKDFLGNVFPSCYEREVLERMDGLFDAYLSIGIDVCDGWRNKIERFLEAPGMIPDGVQD